MNKFLQKLEKGPIICAEGYVFELERRGYLQAGAFVPEVVLDHPEALIQLHRDFVRCGSDVVEALTYYAHREKLRLIGREDELESMNREALRIAGGVARETGTLLAGNISNTNIYHPEEPDTHREVREIFEEQVAWAQEEGADYIIAETISFYGEAKIALEVIAKTGLPAVVTFAVHRQGLRDGVEVAEACRRLSEQGAAVVGVNCLRGPTTMLPVVEKITKVVDVPVAALPVPFRTHDEIPTFESLKDPGCDCIPGGRSFPAGLDPFTCTRYEIAEFTKAISELGVRYMGVCCGAGPHHVRSMAEALGRKPEASKYSPDMSKHYAFGDDPQLKRHNQEFVNQL